jgi:hypothetical protein
MEKMFRRGHEAVRHSRSRLLIGFGLWATCLMLLYARVWPTAPVLGGDSSGYMAVAADLQDGNLSKLHERTIGYPLLLLAADAAEHPTRALFFLQLLMHFSAVAMLLVLLLDLNVPTQLIALFVVLASLPPAVEPATIMATETAASFFLISGFLGLIGWLMGRSVGWLVGSAVAMGFCGLVRPSFQLVALACAAALVLIAWWWPVGPTRRRLVTGVGGILVGSILIIGGMVAFNQMRFGFAGLTPLIGRSLSTRTVSVLERLPDTYAPVREILIRHRDAALTEPGSDHSGLMYIWSSTGELKQVTGLSDGALSTYMLRLNLDLIRRAPLVYLAAVFRSMATFWLSSATMTASFGSRALQMVWVVLHFAILGGVSVYLVLLAGPAWLILRRRSNLRVSTEYTERLAHQTIAILLVLAVTAYNMLISTLLESGFPRYRVPTDLLLLFAAVLAVHAWRQIREGTTTALSD